MGKIAILNDVKGCKQRHIRKPSESTKRIWLDPKLTERVKAEASKILSVIEDMGDLISWVLVIVLYNEFRIILITFAFSFSVVQE